MKIPKEIKLYCKHCKKHTLHKLKLFKAKSASIISKGQRRFIRKHKKGYGGKAKFIIFKKKQNKKPTFIATCPVCSKKQYYVIPKRMKKVEFK